MKQSQMFEKVLIANRGEIARRIQKTCRRLGIQTVAIYSELDAGALHVLEADEAYCVGGARPDESYLRADKIIQIARDCRASAIHPGYGFLSENAEFAEACQSAGITFIGPTPQTIRQMGSKAQAKALMAAAGVPVVPGYHGIDQAPEVLEREAERVGYPLMIKAAAGGGGKGMRIVHDAANFRPSLESARREAASAFGDDAVILERYLQQPRHIEFQIFGDHSGRVAHLYERDCSTQRRYQKVIEEAPSGFISKEQRKQMAAAAVSAASAVNYHNAGTIEFIVDESGEFFFMEMNTRLQVEHPVTEAILGLDLVEWQLRVASGETLPESFPPEVRGHAVEVRIYAENPAAGFLPSTGSITAFDFPEDVRVDSAVAAGDTVSVHYDPMLAKVIATGLSRDAAIARLNNGLSQAHIAGVQTNLGFLQGLLDLPEFSAGDIHTAFLDWHIDEIIEQQNNLPEEALVVAAVARLLAEESVSTDGADPWSPWNKVDAWRLGLPGKRVGALEHASGLQTFEARGSAGAYELTIAGQTVSVSSTFINGSRYTLTLGDYALHAHVHRSGTSLEVSLGGQRHSFKVASPYQFESKGASGSDEVIAPMPGRVISIEKQADDAVEPGQVLIVMEAMKMEISLKAEAPRKVASLHCRPGDIVEADTVLLRFHPLDETSG